MIEKKNPVLQTNIESLGADEKFSLESDAFMMAFSLEVFEGTTIDYD